MEVQWYMMYTSEYIATNNCFRHRHELCEWEWLEVKKYPTVIIQRYPRAYGHL